MCTTFNICSTITNDHMTTLCDHMMYNFSIHSVPPSGREWCPKWCSRHRSRLPLVAECCPSPVKERERGEEGRKKVEWRNGGREVEGIWEYHNEQGPTSFSVSNIFETSSRMLASTCSWHLYTRQQTNKQTNKQTNTETECTTAGHTYSGIPQLF